MNPCSIHWTAYVTAIAVPVVALIAAWIAFRQSQIARNKLKLDLFERRMAVYTAVQNTLGQVVREGKIDQNLQFEYLRGTSTAKWLFGPEVHEYLHETLWDKLVDFELHNKMLDPAVPEKERVEHIRKRTDVLRWILRQNEEFDNLVQKYLKLRH